MTHRIDVQVAVQPAGFPQESAIFEWVTRIVPLVTETPIEICVRVVPDTEIQALNAQYRGLDQVTNVLAFDHGEVDAEGVMLLGDVAICATRVISEAQAQGKEVVAHLVHLIVHGILHLQGYDHSEDDQAVVMENLEIQLMQQLGFANPYEAVA